MFGLLKRKPKQPRAVRKIFKDLEKSEKQTSKMMAERNDSVKLFHKAHKLEKEGKLDRALSIYMKNLKLYGPKFHNSNHYKRPAIVLEKLGRYDEALNLCSEALGLSIEHSKTKADFDKEFKPRRNRLMKKIDKTK